MTIKDDIAMSRDDARTLLMREPHPCVGTQDVYRAVHEWALRGMGYGLGDHPSTSGERGVLEFLKMSTPPGVAPVIFDVGANVGEWAKEVLSMFGADARYYGFEPSGAAFFGGLAHVMKYAIYNIGLSDVDSTMPLHTDELGSGMASVHPRRLAHFGRSLDTEERSTFRRLDDVCREMHIARIDLLKIDVEGHELAVLRGAGDMLTSGAIGVIQWEMGGCNLDSRTTLQDFWYLLSERYRIYRVVADGLAEVPHYREQDEVFVCCNMVAIWKGAP